MCNFQKSRFILQVLQSISCRIINALVGCLQFLCSLASANISLVNIVGNQVNVHLKTRKISPGCEKLHKNNFMVSDFTFEIVIRELQHITGGLREAGKRCQKHQLEHRSSFSVLNKKFQSWKCYSRCRSGAVKAGDKSVTDEGGTRTGRPRQIKRRKRVDIPPRSRTSPNPCVAAVDWPNQCVTLIGRANQREEQENWAAHSQS